MLLDTTKQFNEFTDLIINRVDSSGQIRRAECKFKNLELEKNVRDVETKVNTLSEASEELHGSSGDITARKTIHEKTLKNLEDNYFTL